MVCFVASRLYAFIKSHSLIQYLREDMFTSSLGYFVIPNFSLFVALFEWVISVRRMRVFRVLQWHGRQYNQTTYMLLLHIFMLFCVLSFFITWKEDYDYHDFIKLSQPIRSPFWKDGSQPLDANNFLGFIFNLNLNIWKIFTMKW
jgi:hypothetical protein